MLILFAVSVHNYSNLPMAMILSFLWGVVVGPVFIAASTIIQLVSDEGMRGKVFSALEIVIHFAFLVAMLLSSWASEYVPRVSVLMVVGIAVTLVSIFGFIRTRKGGFALESHNMA